MKRFLRHAAVAGLIEERPAFVVPNRRDVRKGFAEIERGVKQRRRFVPRAAIGVFDDRFEQFLLTYRRGIRTIVDDAARLFDFCKRFFGLSVQEPEFERRGVVERIAHDGAFEQFLGDVFVDVGGLIEPIACDEPRLVLCGGT